MNRNDSYEKFIFLSEESKEKFNDLSDLQLNMACVILSSEIREMEMKIERELNGEVK